MSSPDEYESNRRFEDEVRRVAEAVWSLPPGECQPEHYSSDPTIKELDGIARLRDVTHLLMVTVSRRLDKIKSDVRKLLAAERIEAKRGVPVSKWLITQVQLEAEHIKHCRENGVTILTLGAFKARFFNGQSYVGKRRVSAFGSARNLRDDSVNLPEDEYVPLPLRVVADRDGRLKGERTIGLTDLIKLLADGHVVVLLAPFGAGKSLTAREVFLKLAAPFLKQGEGRVPVAINLRDHWGAKYADEILERHAREIGFTPREDIVVAWRAGLVTLILDGFDELAAQVVARPTDRNFMRDARFQALTGVQDLLAKIPSGSGVLITGRDHYFDHQRELAHALGLTSRSYLIIELGEFGEEEAAKYLRRKSVSGTLPPWLPRKPLLLGYLASRGLLDQVLAIDGTRGFGFAWDEFLRRICEREALHGRSIMDADALRHLLERLAFDVRATPSGTGPITERDLAEAYLAETGESPGEGVLMQLQRLPGLTARGQEVGVRSFIDEDMLAALQGSSLARYILEGKPNWTRRGSREPLRHQALVMAAHLLTEAGASASLAVTTAKRAAASIADAAIDAQVAADCLEVAFRLAEENGSIDCLGLVLSGVYLGTLPLEGFKINDLTLDACLVDDVPLDELGLQSRSSVRNCDIQRVSGVSSAVALPSSMFQNCTVESFDDLSTNAAIVRSALHPRLKALLTILRKLYLQSGAARKLNAFKRGLPPGPVLDAVQPVLEVLESEGLIVIEKGMAHPVRRHMARVRAIIESANLSTDALVQRVVNL